ncbi:hypothetical protein NYZ99_14555 [Maribacter litopenaei]|uniref:Uncharacterized protein n=1 Tax=Maribacter litopenaei TaxID=2976127 RepID=A0ABY5Y897_9FLAO|nr:hypothetical protein [Maribacter litopenaei]UWX54196.1 hypothetical protein NYZ99_14555 [Maribacter litopenaei]
MVDVEEPVHIERSIENEDSIVLEDVKPDLIISNKDREDKGEREGNVQPRAGFVQETIPDTSAIAENAPPPPLGDDDVPLVSTEILDAKIAEVIAKVDIIELNGKVSDAEVDSLLLNAQKEILREKLFNMDKSVNAMALLSEVEEELDQSFRDQIFETLKTGFLKVRTAVADRNN